MNVERRERIRESAEGRDFIGIRELREMFPEVSVMTLHRDLDALEAAGFLRKVRGGARVVRHATEPLFDLRTHANMEEKLIIARKAAALVRPDSSVFLDAGTTNLVLARELPDTRLDVFTTGPNIALELCRLENYSVNLCGGNINRSNLAISGQSTLDMLANINIDLAFIGVSGCDAECGFTCGKESEMLVKRLVIKKARTSVLLCDASKLGRILPFTFAAFGEADCIICESEPPEEYLRAAHGAGMTVL